MQQNIGLITSTRMMAVLSGQILRTTPSYWRSFGAEERAAVSEWFCCSENYCDEFKGVSFEYLCAHLALDSASVRFATGIANQRVQASAKAGMVALSRRLLMELRKPETRPALHSALEEILRKAA